MKELRDLLAEHAAVEETMALVTIVGTTGSSYRKAGARMLVRADGRHLGTLSGGCIEDEVARRALPVMKTGEPALFSVDTRRRFGCHGSIEVFAERIEPGHEFMRYLAYCLDQRVPAHVKVVFDPGAVRRGSYALDSLDADTEGFEETLLPPVRLVVCGDSPGNEALAGLSRILGWDCILTENPEAEALQMDARTAVVIKNHHFGRDFVALRWALAQTCGYVGLLGSRRRRRELLDALLAEGWEPGPGALGHFFGPAGLDLGAEEPEHIALSITAEIQAVMSRHQGGFLRDRPGPIHEILCTAAAL